MPANQIPISRLFDSANALDFAQGKSFSEVRPKGGVVATAERLGKAFSRQLESLRCQHVSPREPVVIGRIQQCAVHVPKDGASLLSHRFVVCCITCSPLPAGARLRQTHGWAGKLSGSP